MRDEADAEPLEPGTGRKLVGGAKAGSEVDEQRAATDDRATRVALREQAVAVAEARLTELQVAAEAFAAREAEKRTQGELRLAAARAAIDEQAARVALREQAAVAAETRLAEKQVAAEARAARELEKQEQTAQREAGRQTAAERLATPGARTGEATEALPKALQDEVALELSDLADCLAGIEEAVTKLEARDVLYPDDLRRVQRQPLGSVALRSAEDQVGEPPSAEPLVVFLHIPKAAGTTIGHELKLLHGYGYVRGGNFEKEPERVRKRAAQVACRTTRVAVVQGHLPFSVRSLYSADAQFFTLLRSPVERAVSHFYFIHRLAHLGKWWSPLPIPRAELTLADALAERHADPAIRHKLLPDNLQTRMLSGFEPDAPATREMLDTALRNLAKLDAVGIVERFDESIALIHLTFGWRMLLAPDRRVNFENRPAVHEIPEPELTLVRALNELDEELYAEGQKLFEATAAKLGDRLAIEVEALERAWELLENDGAASRPGDSLRSELVEERARAIVAETRVAILERRFRADGAIVADLARDVATAKRARGHLGPFASETPAG